MFTLESNKNGQENTSSWPCSNKFLHQELQKPTSRLHVSNFTAATRSDCCPIHMMMLQTKIPISHGHERYKCSEERCGFQSSAVRTMRVTANQSHETRLTCFRVACMLRKSWESPVPCENFSFSIEHVSRLFSNRKDTKEYRSKMNIRDKLISFTTRLRYLVDVFQSNYKLNCAQILFEKSQTSEPRNRHEAEFVWVEFNLF